MATLSRSAVYSEDCPECKSSNYFDEGDPNDQTGTDVEGLKCWNCGHEWLLEFADEWTTLEDAFIEDGRKKA